MYQPVVASLVRSTDRKNVSTNKVEEGEEEVDGLDFRYRWIADGLVSFTHVLHTTCTLHAQTAHTETLRSRDVMLRLASHTVINRSVIQRFHPQLSHWRVRLACVGPGLASAHVDTLLEPTAPNFSVCHDSEVSRPMDATRNTERAFSTPCRSTDRRTPTGAPLDPATLALVRVISGHSLYVLEWSTEILLRHFLQEAPPTPSSRHGHLTCLQTRETEQTGSLPSRRWGVASRPRAVVTLCGQALPRILFFDSVYFLRH